MTNTIPGYMLTSECELLESLFSEYNSAGSIGVEIGSFIGRSAFSISKSIPNGTLYCIDRWDEWETEKPKPYSIPDNKPTPGTKCSLDTFKENTKECKNIVPIKGDCPDVVKDWAILVDFVFLDALHSNPSDRKSIDFWLPKIKKGGMFAGHDYYPAYPKLYPDILENILFLENYLGQKVNYPGIGSIWYFKI